MNGSFIGKNRFFANNFVDSNTSSGIWNINAIYENPYVETIIPFSFNSETPAFEVNTRDVSSITIPAGASAGQLAILFCSIDDPASRSLTSNWNVIINDVNTTGVNNSDVTVAWKILTASDPGSSLTCYGATNSTWYLAVFDSNLSNVTVAGLQQQVTTGTASNQTIAASTGNAPLLVVAFKVASQDTAATISGMTGYTALSGSQSTSEPAQRVRFKYYASSPSNETITTVDDGFGQLFASWYMELS